MDDCIDIWTDGWGIGWTCAWKRGWINVSLGGHHKLVPGSHGTRHGS